jgi:MarR family transcriptional regulator, organic hydroperoxide resistance regulator
MTAIGREGATDRSDLTNQIIAEFGTFFRELRCMGSDRMRRGGVSSAHFHLLAMLDRHGEMVMSRVAEALDVSLSNASGLIDRLEERGLVERIRVPDDRRIVLVKLTGTGRKTLGEAEVLKEELVGRVLRRLDSGQLNRLNEVLTDLKEAVRATLDSDPSWQAHAQAHASFHAAGHRGADRPSQATEVIAGEV